MNKDTFEDQINEAANVMRDVTKNCQVSIEELANALAKLSNSGLKVKDFEVASKSLAEVTKVKQPWYTKLRKFFLECLI